MGISVILTVLSFVIMHFKLNYHSYPYCIIIFINQQWQQTELSPGKRWPSTTLMRISGLSSMIRFMMLASTKSNIPEGPSSL